MKRAIIFASLLASTAYADPDEAINQSKREFSIILHETEWINGNRLGKDLKETPPNKCSDLVASLKAAGAPANTEFQLMGVGKVLLSELPARVCTPYERAVHSAEAAQMLATTKDGKQCAAEMDRLLKFGIADIEIEARDVELKLGEAKKKICDPVAKGQPISKEEKAKARDAAAAPYVEAGITGGKLNVCIANGPNIRGLDGVTLLPKKIKRADVLFVLKGPVEGAWTLQRLAFKGDEIDAVSDKTFSEEPKPADYK